MFLRSNNRVKCMSYLHGSFIRKMCASNTRSFQGVTLHELDSVKISPGLKAAVIVQGESAAQALVPAPGWCGFSWQLSLHRVCGPAEPPRSQTQQVSKPRTQEEIPEISRSLFATAVVGCPKGILRWARSSVRECQTWVERLQLLKSTKFSWAKGDMGSLLTECISGSSTWERVRLSKLYHWPNCKH